MNRVKIWVLTLIAAGAGAAGLYLVTESAVERAQVEQDARLTGAAAHFAARAELLGRQVAEAAEAASRAETVRGAAAAGGGLAAVAQGALEPAAKAAGLDPSRMLLGSAQGPSARVEVAGKPLDAKEPLVQRTIENAGAKAQKGFAHTADGVFYTATAPAGPGAAVVAGAPLDLAFARAFRAESGVEVLVSADVKKTVSTLPPTESPALFALPRTASGAPVGVGRLGPAQVAGAPLPLLFANPPAWRVRLEKLGASGAAVLLALPTAPRLAGLVAFQYGALAALAALLLLGLVLGATASDGQRVPKDLLTAAEKIGRGDYTARAPVVSGPLGTVAQGMNRAAQAALAMHAISREEPATQAPFDARRPLAEREPAPPAAAVLPPEAAPAAAPYAPESPAADLFGAPGVPPRPEPPAYEPPPAFAPPAAPAYERPPAPPAYEPPPAREAPAWQPSAYEPPAPEASAYAPPPAQEQEAVPLPPPRSDSITGATNLTTPTRELMLHGMAAAAEQLAAPAPSGEEQAWREVYQRFLEARTQSGEGTAGLSYEKFEAKLQKNRQQLQDKYGCRDVRFSVYLKEGRAALKATPVK
ncbi:MAG TPA: MXAN_5187 family protein [Anaeromyxobacteraceae bacterium]|jgi:hypothetical protein|nr:MXAN_5187 family protein [Anaeromyxobacteraceae bacterium]